MGKKKRSPLSNYSKKCGCGEGYLTADPILTLCFGSVKVTGRSQ